MIILSEHDATATPAGERSPLKSPASYPNVILSPVAEEAPGAPPPYGSTPAAATARHALSPAAQRDYNSYSYQYQSWQKLFRPAPYTRRTTGRFFYALFVAVLICTVFITVVQDNTFDFIVNPKKYGIGLNSNGTAQDIVSEIEKMSTERHLPMQYPPTRLRCTEEVAEPTETLPTETSALS